MRIAADTTKNRVLVIGCLPLHVARTAGSRDQLDE
jgi:hypothetical protein